MCGIIGIVAHGPVNQAIYDALTVLQHRGQDAAGIMTCEDGSMHLRKDNGLVRDVFHIHHMLPPARQHGHRPCTLSDCRLRDSAEAQPFYVNSPYGISLAHNGNLTNANKLKQDCSRKTCAISTPTPIPRCCSTCSRTNCSSTPSCSIDANDVFKAVARCTPALPWRLRGGGDDHRLRHHGFPRSATAYARSSSASAKPRKVPIT